MVIEQFMSIFDGLQEAYGTFRIEKQAANGKAQGKAGVVREPRTMLLWENHLGGRHGIGIIPITRTTTASGVVSTLISTLWTTPCWFQRYAS